MPEPTAPVFEIFSGIQGEGILVGVRQVLVRFCGCNRRCFFAPGSRQFADHRNPMTAAAVARAAAALDAPRGLHHSVSLTGGEPLIHAELLAALCPLLAEHGLPVYLETNGTLPEALERVLDGVQHVAMDIKLESATGQATPWEAHYRFLDLALRRSAQVKIVVAADTTDRLQLPEHHRHHGFARRRQARGHHRRAQGTPAPAPRTEERHRLLRNRLLERVAGAMIRREQGPKPKL